MPDPVLENHLIGLEPLHLFTGKSQEIAEHEIIVLRHQGSGGSNTARGVAVESGHSI